MVISTLISVTIMAQSDKSNRVGKEISPNLFGLFFEDINYAADGGLYAELVQNRSFEYNPEEQRTWHPFSFWEYVTPGFSYGHISVETNSPVHPNNLHYIILDIEFVGNFEQHQGASGVGIRNTGFDGIVIRQGEKYDFSMFAKQLTDTPIEFLVRIENPNGEVLGEEKVITAAKDWQKYTASLTATANSDSASLLLLATKKGKLAIDMVSLFPQRTYKNRKNGLRPDLALVLAEMKPAFVRFPGGCLVHGSGLANMYRWKNTIGPLEERKGQKNLWGYHQTAGLGFYEYFQFCEDIGAKPLPVLPAGVSCQNSGGTWRIGGTGQQALPMTEMDDFIQEILDLIEWANGPATSVWGAKRAMAGHPAPFNLEYIGIGNEDKITPEFETRFRLIYEAVKINHPEITIIGTSGPFHSGDDFEKGWKFADDIRIPVVDEHYYVQPDWLLSNVNRYDKYDRNKAKVYLGEYASWGNKMKNALAEAAYMIAMERNGDIISMASYAPLFAKKNHTQWKTDMIFFDNNQIYLTPNYYVQQLFSLNRGNFYFDNIILKNASDTTLAASCVQDKKTGDLILKMVNTDDAAKTLKIDLTPFKRFIPQAEQMVLSGDAEAENTPENPENVVPIKSVITVGKTFEYNAPMTSLTIIRIKTKNSID